MNTTREESQRSIMQMCRGAFQERVDYEMPRLIENILDPNTSAKAKRPATTMLYAADKDTVIEMAPQIPGQIAVDGSEQEAPAHLRLVNCG